MIYSYTNLALDIRALNNLSVDATTGTISRKDMAYLKQRARVECKILLPARVASPSLRSAGRGCQYQMQTRLPVAHPRINEILSF